MLKVSSHLRPVSFPNLLTRDQPFFVSDFCQVTLRRMIYLALLKTSLHQVLMVELHVSSRLSPYMRFNLTVTISITVECGTKNVRQLITRWLSQTQLSGRKRKTWGASVPTVIYVAHLLSREAYTTTFLGSS